jgi:hypothetical protein
MTDDDKKELVKKLRQQQNDIKKELKNLLSTANDSKKLAEWRLIHDIKQDVKSRLKKHNISWKKFLITPDYFTYAWYAGKTQTAKTSMTKPSSTETNIDEALMLKNAEGLRYKLIRRKTKKRVWKKSENAQSASSGKSNAIGSIGVG